MATMRAAFASPAVLRPAAAAVQHALQPARARIANTSLSRRCRATMAPDATPARAKERTDRARPKLTLLYDGDCPLCLKEVAFLRARGARMGAQPPIAFVDIADPAYAPAENAGVGYETAMGLIHGITADGRVLVGVPVFREAYEAVGLGWVYAATRLPVVGPAVDAVYGVWARWRLQLTGRPPLEEIMRMRRSGVDKTCR